MDRLRSPGGCPWDAEQTHQSLAEYLLEETYETLAAIEAGDDVELVEELGDLLLQVVFHARLGQEADPAWDIDDVTRGIADKLVRRHPHVFETDSPEADSAATGTSDAQLARNWTRAKAAEKGRTSALDGIPRALPALAQAQKTWRRAHESGLELAEVPSGDTFSDRLLGLVIEAERSGVDAEAALRAGIDGLREQIRASEAGRDTAEAGGYPAAPRSWSAG